MSRLLLTRDEFDSLLDYSCSLPTGTKIGKTWKRGEPYGRATRWYRGEYVEDPDPKLVGIVWREISLTDRWGFPVSFEPADRGEGTHYPPPELARLRRIVGRLARAMGR